MLWLTGSHQFEEGFRSLSLLFRFEAEVDVRSIAPKRCNTALNLKAAFAAIDGRESLCVWQDILGKGGLEA
jgi:hypothetical protein